MDGLELLKSWPGWSNAGAETILASPAWRMPVRLGEVSGEMRFGTAPLADTIDLDVTLDDEPHVLSLADSPRFPDLHRLWARRDGLPAEIVLALLEKECGEVLALLEKAMRRLLAVRGLAAAPSPEARVLQIDAPGGAVALALDLSPEVRTTFARLEHLDVSHPSIRELTRPARADYGSLELDEEARGALSPGDHLVVPDSFAGAQRWIVEAPSDDAVHICSAASQEIAFAAFADEALPPVPEPSDLVLLHRGRELRPCRLSRVGTARTVRIF